MAPENGSPQSVEIRAAANLEALRKNPYPGRGFIMGFDSTGQTAIQVYWVMGRSENSRNRILVQEGDVVRTEPFDESKVKDPSLIIYNAMRIVNGVHIVSNGDQTDTVFRAINKWEDTGRVKAALGERLYEPDAPNFTPRITGIIATDQSIFHPDILFSEISKKSANSDDARYDNNAYRMEDLMGIGRCIHTYEGDGNPLPSFKKEPYEVPLKGSIDDIAKTYWDALNGDNKVSLVVKTIDLYSGRTDYRIMNKLSK